MIPFYDNPGPDSWPELCRRPIDGNAALTDSVTAILNRVKQEGDAALLELTRRFDAGGLESLRVCDEEFRNASACLTRELCAAIDTARKNIAAFHGAQLTRDVVVETMPGVQCRQRMLPLERIGLYVPGGSAPLFSTLLMLGVPAQLAGCTDIVVCTPPDKNGTVAPAILHCADLLGIRQVFKVGGAQAIAAMAFGTESIAPVDKIFGPGNSYVTRAKQQVQVQGCAIDMPAGPSELLIIADADAVPEFVAADMLSQAEHGPDSQVLLLSDSKRLLRSVEQAIRQQLGSLPRREIIRQALQHARLLYFDSIERAIDFSNAYAPEHLSLASDRADEFSEAIRHAGTVFLGHLSAESAGDYATGANHTLPTSAAARACGALGTSAFMKAINYQKLNSDGLKHIGPIVRTLASAEFMQAHGQAITLRMEALEHV